MSLQLRILTFNIRYATSSPFKGEELWHVRCPLVLSQIKHELWPARPYITDLLSSSSSGQVHGGAFVCLQEALHSQLVDVLSGLNGVASTDDSIPDGPVWAHIGVGRDDGKTKGEYSPIIYPKKIFDVLHSETVWLSPTPDRPSKGWDAGSIRILTVGVFEHKTSKHRVIATNTHLDNSGSRSRLESVSIITKTIQRVQTDWGVHGKTGTFLCGDFNSFPTQEAYLAMQTSGLFGDLHDEVNVRDLYGEIDTFTGFQPDHNINERGRIDFIWLGRDKAKTDGGQTQLKGEGYAVLSNQFENGIYFSDHRAVVGDVMLG